MIKPGLSKHRLYFQKVIYSLHNKFSILKKYLEFPPFSLVPGTSLLNELFSFFAIPTLHPQLWGGNLHCRLFNLTEKQCRLAKFHAVSAVDCFPYLGLLHQRYLRELL